MPVRTAILLGLLALGACSESDEAAPQPRRNDAGSPAAAATATASSGSAGKAVKVEEDNKVYSYEFSYPAAVGAIPALAARLSERAEQAKAEMIAEAKAMQS